MTEGISPRIHPTGQGADGTGMQLFNNDEFSLEIRLVGDSFIVRAPGLARSLAFHSAKDMLRTVPGDEKGWEIAPTLGGDQEMWHVTEPGLYRVIGQRQAARIKDPSIRDQVARFQRWVYHDVLPQIRKTGGYGVPAARSIPEDYPAALRAIADEIEAHGKTRARLDYAQPFADAYLDLMDADGTFEWAVVAQIFWSITGGLGRNNFLELLRSDELKVLKRNNTPYQVHGADRRFKVTPHRSGPDADATTRVTPEGLDWLRGRLLKHFNRQEPLFVIGALA